MFIQTRHALPSDADRLIAFDHVAATDPRRVEAIQRGIAAGTIFVADAGGVSVGYALFDHSFFGHGMIKLLYTSVGIRRRGVASALIVRCESECQTAKLFTSANLSNTPMQALLAKHGFDLTGIIENLDEGDPELVYLKRLIGKNK